MLDLPDQPTGNPRRLFQCFVKLPAHVRPAACQFNGSLSSIGKGAIARVTITLNFAVEVRRNDVFQTTGRTTGFPLVKTLATGTMSGPKVTLPGLAVARLQIFNRRFVHLHITSGQHPGTNLL